ncbi:MAG TPA: alanine racemase [Pyrinomonadaceae bacterium]|nr:alanine racemase [Pyrinomonadaceae bacterium]
MDYIFTNHFNYRMSPDRSQRPTWAEIDLDNLAFNFHSTKEFVGKEIEYMAVVKANAYGHGAVQCAKRLEAEGVDWFAVALPEEGIELREAGSQKPILCLGGFWPGQERLLLKHDLTPVVFNIEQAEILNAAAKALELKAPIHIKIDTGMGRLGIRFDELADFAARLSELKNLEVEGLMTHFAVADKLSQNEFTNLQMARFGEAVSIFHGHGFRPKYLDMANSPGAVAHPLSRATMVRLGGVLYGLGGDVLPAEIEKPELKPVLSLHSAISMLKNVPMGETLGYGRTFQTKRDSIIATIPIGYHDGVSRSLSNKGRVIVNGKFAPIVGRVSMDWAIIDVTDIPDAKIGDTVTLIGKQGESDILAEDIAALIDTISYEVTCSIDQRVPRIFKAS